MRELKLNKEIYNVEKIMKTMNVYRGYAKCSMSYDGDYTIVTFDDCKYDENITIREFENYLIGLENS
jgi:hypothetical protein